MAQTCPYCGTKFTQFDLIFVATHYPVGIKCRHCTKTIKIPLLIYLGYAVFLSITMALLFVVLVKILFPMTAPESVRALAILASIVVPLVAVHFLHISAMNFWIARHRTME